MNEPPPPPRTAPPDAFWQWLRQDALAIVASVFVLLGVGLLLLGAGVLFIIGPPVRVDLIFFLIGSVFLSWSLPLWLWRYRHHRRELHVWVHGEATPGYVTRVIQNRAVRINRQHPWIVHYRFGVLGQPYDGHAARWNIPEAHTLVGQPVYVVYLPHDPRRSTLYERE